MKQFVTTLLCLSLAACGGGEVEKPEPGKGAESSASKPSEPAKPEPKKDPMLEPFTSFAHQLELLRQADLEGLKACMVESAHADIDVDKLELIAEHFETLPPEDYARSVVVEGDYAKLKFPSGKVFETLRRVDGKWLAQTPWWQMASANK